MKTQLLPSVLASSLFFALNAHADHQAQESEDDDFLDFSLEELISLDIPDVTSVSRKKQRLMDSAAAIYVITSEDILRSGVTSIPEALRMVPGMQVARLNGNIWSISTRGFNYIFANKLLVLIDGRTVYSPLFSGVNWDVQDTLMEDIDRIEVIRGPGAALWGANAVNGVINVITKKAADTQGNLVSLGAGNEEKAFGAYRHGGEFGETGFYKVYVKTFERDGLAKADGSDANDDWKMKRVGFRAEWKPAADTDFTLLGDIYEGTTRPALTIFKNDEPYAGDKGMQTFENTSRDQRGGNLIAHWKKTLSDTEDYSLKAVIDDYQNFDYRVTEKRQSFDLEFQHYFQPIENHDLVWGLSFRRTWYQMSDMRYIIHRDENGQPKDSRQDNLYSLFAQDDITLNHHWNVSFSARYEHNEFTGKEFQPNAKLTWKVNDNRTLWASVSKAVKTPSVSETSVYTDNITFFEADFDIPYAERKKVLAITDNRDLESEKLTAFELGYREQFGSSFRLDVTGFYNRYSDIVAYVAQTSCPDGSPIIGGFICPTTRSNFYRLPSTLINGIDATTYGLETVADWQVKDWWKLQLSYSWLQVDASPNTSNPNLQFALKGNEELIENLSANHTMNLRSNMNLSHQWYFDVWIRGISNMKNANVPGYTALDVRLAKKVNENLEFSLVAQNLFDKQRDEFNEIFSGLSATEIEESWYAQIRWSF
ncbi:TonB-dependent receptor plug domain-containing protein [Endozoicomonas euniceicola]|uniref:TonB-dependent receptor n=1 Tax=Endozoicomonas euniceicola TaxID=1234143 RepID=A0ABY6GZP3_9GAMM|nr:TonB-dependent receptor [Endozoicomonas euniceicola]UYM17844.1 TonB-dependent receptor [Endozoicomonas euniceicola]